MQEQANLIRADRALKQRMPSLTARHIAEAFHAGLVTDTSRRKLKKGCLILSSQLEMGALKELLENQKQGKEIADVKVVADRNDFWVVDKPAGVHSHPLSLFDENTITNWAFRKDSKLWKEFPEVQPTVTPHRLDLGTSGLLIVAKTGAAYSRFRKYFSEKKIQKVYHAWTWGNPSWDEKEVRAAIRHAPGDLTRMVVEKTAGEKGKTFQAYSKVNVIERQQGRFLAEVSCFTGVTHQVRVHMASLGHPLVGDELYDKDEKRNIGIPHHQLRAIKLITPEGEFEAEARVNSSVPKAYLGD